MTKSSKINVPISTDVFIGLVDFLREKGSDRDPVDVIREAILYWIENADWKEEALMPEIFRKPSHSGYLWKNVRLPSGSRIRMHYGGRTYHASVDGDDFVYDGEITSPSKFANKVAGSARNAWRDLWIRRPEDQDFRSAEELRRERQSREPDPLGIDWSDDVALTGEK